MKTFVGIGKKASPARVMDSSTILQAFPEWLIQLFSYWIRPFDPKGLPCRGREALLHSQKHWYASLLFHSHKTKILFAFTLQHFYPFFPSTQPERGAPFLPFVLSFHTGEKNKWAFCVFQAARQFLTRHWEGLHCEICSRMWEALWMTVNHQLPAPLDIIMNGFALCMVCSDSFGFKGWWIFLSKHAVIVVQLVSV